MHFDASQVAHKNAGVVWIVLRQACRNPTMIIKPMKYFGYYSKQPPRKLRQYIHNIRRPVLLVVLTNGGNKGFYLIMDLNNGSFALSVNVYDSECFIGIVLESLFHDKRNTERLAFIKTMTGNKPVKLRSQCYRLDYGSAQHMKECIFELGLRFI